MQEGIVIWFRNDLRLKDNEVLTRALETGLRVYPVYCFDPRHFREQQLGFAKTGVYRAKFLIESLENLHKNLQKLGSGLIIRHGHPEEEIVKLALETKASKIYASREVTQEEIAVENSLEKALCKSAIEIKWYWQSTMIHIDDIPWSIQQLPEVFTNFRKGVEKVLSVREVMTTPKSLPPLPDIDMGTIPDLDDLGLPRPQNESIFKGGEDEAWKRLMHYFWESHCLSGYKETRNGLLGRDYSSKFSPWLALGCISAKAVYWEVIKYESAIEKNDSTYWLVFELLWRDYFRFIAKKHGNKIFKSEGIQGVKHDYINDPSIFKQWMDGDTGEAFVDANMKELNVTGFMSNRGRQNVASYLIHDLNINWVWGAAYFESVLIDYDPCSNWGNWGYIARVGNDPRKNRYFNVKSQAARYDPEGNYIKYWLQNAQNA